MFHEVLSSWTLLARDHATFLTSSSVSWTSSVLDFIIFIGALGENLCIFTYLFRILRLCKKKLHWKIVKFFVINILTLCDDIFYYQDSSYNLIGNLILSIIILMDVFFSFLMGVFNFYFICFFYIFFIILVYNRSKVVWYTETFCMLFILLLITEIYKDKSLNSLLHHTNVCVKVIMANE